MMHGTLTGAWTKRLKGLPPTTTSPSVTGFTWAALIWGRCSCTGKFPVPPTQEDKWLVLLQLQKGLSVLYQTNVIYLRFPLVLAGENSLHWGQGLDPHSPPQWDDWSCKTNMQTHGVNKNELASFPDNQGTRLPVNHLSLKCTSQILSIYVLVSG